MHALCAVCHADHAVEEEVQRVRLKNIHLANALKKLEATIRCVEAWQPIALMALTMAHSLGRQHTSCARVHFL